MEYNLENHPSSDHFYSECDCDFCKWFVGFKKELPTPFSEIQAKIQWILNHEEVANKKWYLDQIMYLFTFIELKLKEILGEPKK